MYIYKSQPTRNRLHINWAQEYMLGLIDANPDCNTSTVIKMASTAMSINTAHRYITQLVERELIEQTINQYDRRYTTLSITNIGREVLNEIEQSAMDCTDE